MTREFLSLAFALLAPLTAFAGKEVFPNITPERRREFMRRAQLWQPGDIASRDVMKGPDNPNGFEFNQTVVCDYVSEKSGGTNPKFKCRLADGRTISVKFGIKNHEIYGEALGSRLLWLLGFGASRSYPIKVVCRGCPENPHQPARLDGKIYSTLKMNGTSAGAPYPLNRMAPQGARIFYPALAKEFLPGPVIESREDEGWRWPELDIVSVEGGGAPRAHRDALKLLAAFMQHVDNSGGNQSLYCPEANVVKDSEGTATDCTRPEMYISDIGSSFGTGARINISKELVNHRGWQKQKIWADSKNCIANLQGIVSIYHSSLNRPQIGEEGRKFLADLLSQVTDVQMEELFTLARVEFADKVGYGVWKKTFKEKVREIVEHPPCPTR